MESSYILDAKVFKAFCDENRLKVLERLRSGEMCACALIEELDIGQSALSYHMKILIESGVVTARQEGKWTHYSISKAGSARAMELLREITTPKKQSTAKIEAVCCDK